MTSCLVPEICPADMRPFDAHIYKLHPLLAQIHPSVPLAIFYIFQFYINTAAHSDVETTLWSEFQWEIKQTSLCFQLSLPIHVSPQPFHWPRTGTGWGQHTCLTISKPLRSFPPNTPWLSPYPLRSLNDGQSSGNEKLRREYESRAFKIYLLSYK